MQKLETLKLVELQILLISMTPVETELKKIIIKPIKIKTKMITKIKFLKNQNQRNQVNQKLKKIKHLQVPFDIITAF